MELPAWSRILKAVPARNVLLVERATAHSAGMGVFSSKPLEVVSGGALSHEIMGYHAILRPVLSVARFE